MERIKLGDKMTKNFNFQTEQFNYSVVTLKGEKKHYIEGYISTIDADSYNEVVTLKGQQEILEQIQNKVITMDVEHEEWYDENNQMLDKPRNEKIPVAKIVGAELKSRGVWVKAEINAHGDRFKNIWGSIKDGFLHSFSVAFYPIRAVTKAIDGIERTFIDALELINVTLTGSPVNTNATFKPVMKAALKSEGITMSEETKTEQPAQEEVKAEEPVQEEKTVTEEVKPAVDEITKKLEEQNATLVKEKADLEQQLADQKTAAEKATQEATQANEAVKEAEGPLANIKSLLSNQEQLKAQIKALQNAPVMKAQFEAAPKAEQPEIRSPLDSI